MTPSILIFAACVAIVTLAAALIYRRLWIRLRGTLVTPTGFGAFLALALLAGSMVLRMPGNVVIAFSVIVAATAVYWLDDLRELSARLRMALSFATGSAVCGLLLPGDGDLPMWVILGACLAAGGLNVVLTNIINFYDGADLNLATVIALTAGGILLLSDGSPAMTVSAVACFAFIAPFAVLNSRPRSIYLGDAGSFAFASLVTMMAIIYLRGGDELPPTVAIPLALPAFDTFYVFCVRMIEKHDLLTRNYLHLYQKVNVHRPGFLYLVPQIVNALLLLAAATGLQAVGLSPFFAVLIAAVGVTIPFYFGCRKFLLPRNEQAGVS
jgi:UDP-N-acetylmuramyl pentapeptide phosphotransferase/UDP-N-acetylglucosamine-1-phosphate transferase